MKHVFIFLFLFAGSALIASNGPGSGYEPGDVATDFSLRNVDGKMVSLADYPDARGFIVIFTCNHCPFAVKYEDRIIELHNKYAAKGYPVIAINPNDPEVAPDDSYELMKVRAQEKGFDFPYLFDEGQKIYPQYGATRTPHVYLLDSRKVVKYIGAIDDNVDDAQKVEHHYLEDAIKAMEAGEEIERKVTKAIGCTIKVKEQVDLKN
jgi:peroxiredoxin